MVICKHCQAELPEYIRLCGRCGNSTDGETFQFQQDKQEAYSPLYAPPVYPSDRPEDVSEKTGNIPTQLPFGAINFPPPQSMVEVPPIQGGGAGFGQYGSYGQVVHGAHHQAQVVHGAHHQAQVVHGVHHQAQAVHGAHHQAQAVHGAHHQAQAQAAQGGTGHVQHIREGCRPSCLTAVISTAIVVTVVTVSLFLLFPHIFPGGAQPTLNMPTSVSPGEIIAAQGSNFSSGQRILITLDTQQKARAGETASPLSADLLGPVQVLAQQHPQQGTLLTVKNDGTFTATVQADQSWPEGSQHTLYILRQDGSLIVRKPFTIKGGSPALTLCSVSTTSATITLGPVAAGQNASISTPFKLCTRGSGQVDWSSSWDAQQAPWLLLVRNGHVQAPEVQPLQFSASSASLKAGNYTTTVTFSSQRSATQITVKVILIVQDQNAPACIQPSSTSLTLTGVPGQGNPAQQSVTLSNCGEDSNWLAVTTTDDGANWLSVNPGNGTLQKGASQNVAVTAATTNLVAGTYTGHVVFSSGSNAARIDVAFVVTNTPQVQPCLAANTGQLNFTAKAQGGNPVAQGITITNACGTGSWSASMDQSWLSLSTVSGNVNAKSSINLNAQASIANLAAGTYTGHVTFYPGAATVTVILNVQVVPCISAQGSPLNISVMEGNTSSNATARVSFGNGANCASGSWTAQSDVSWITLSTSSGSLNAGASNVIPVTINENAVGTGSFTGHITFSPGSGSSVMTINLTVYRRLCITARPTSLSFTGYVGRSSPAAQTITVTNCANAGTVSISNITTDSGGSWLHATGGGSLGAGGRQTFSVTVSPGSNAGTYTGHVYITVTGSDGGTTSIRVDVTYSVSYIIY